MDYNQLVNGLLYLHEELSLSHGALDCSTILLNLNGIVKIGTSLELDTVNANLLEPTSATHSSITKSSVRKACGAIFAALELS